MYIHSWFTLLYAVVGKNQHNIVKQLSYDFFLKMVLLKKMLHWVELPIGCWGFGLFTLFGYSEQGFYKFCLSSVAQLCPALWHHVDCSTTGFPVHQQLLKLDQTRVHWVSDTIQPSHHLSSRSPPAFNLSQHKGLFQWISSSHPVVKVLELQLQHQSFQWILRTDSL